MWGWGSDWLLSGDELFQAQRDAAFVAGSGILFDNAPFCGTIDQRKSVAQSGSGALSVFVLEQTTESPQLVTQPSFAQAIDLRLLFGAAHPF